MIKFDVYFSILREQKTKEERKQKDIKYREKIK